MTLIWKLPAVCCLLTMPALSAGAGTLRGIVHDPQHRPLPGAQVALHGPSSNLIQERTLRRQRGVSSE
jgi:hypothetical protein